MLYYYVLLGAKITMFVAIKRVTDTHARYDKLLYLFNLFLICTRKRGTFNFVFL